MKRTWILAGLTLFGLRSVLPAQERVFAFGGGRPRIGISVDTRADAEDDKLGARIREVVPDGPATKLGLLRVIDESGEDYLYPQTFFAPIDLPQPIRRAVLAAV